MELQSAPGGASQGTPVPFSEVGERFISAAPGRAAEKFLCEAQHQSHRSFRKVLITHFGEIFSPSFTRDSYLTVGVHLTLLKHTV